MLVGRKQSIMDKIKDSKNPPVVMGILNVTPDSFYSASRVLSIDEALFRVERMVSDGADIVDIGGESTRPGSSPVSEDEELKRVIPVVKAVKERFPEVIVSVDTYKAKVAEEALLLGVEIVNDISAARLDPKMVEVLVKYNPIYVLMHMKGTPRDMQVNPYYDDVVKEVRDFFLERISFFEERGYSRDSIIIDPGIGFGKRLVDNLKLIKAIPIFSEIAPILIGPSRKSFIGMILNGAPPEDRLEGTLVSVALSVFLGARVVRVHDVKEAVRAVKVAWAIANETC